MKKIKNIFMTVLLMLLSVGVVACSNQKNAKSDTLTKNTLIVGLNPSGYGPFSHLENGKLTGFEVEMAKALTKKMGYKIKFVPTKWDSLIAGLGAKKFDVVINDIAVTPERKKAYAFSTPYLYSRSVLIMRSDNSKIKKITDIRGEKVAAATGTANADLVRKFGGENLSSPDFSTAMELVRQKRVTSAMNSKESFLYFKKTQKVSDLKYLQASDTDIPTQPVAIMLNKDNSNLQTKINNALKSLRKDGTLTKLSKKYFAADITKK